MVGTAPVGCGQCLACRINHRRLWTWRCVLESFCHKESCFVTLTYNQDWLPASGSVYTGELRNFMKRLRRYLEPRKIRFVGVGEYGDESFRPHYHLCLFGVSALDYAAIEKAWRCEGEPLGFVHVGDFNQDSGRYLCAYTMKKMTKADDPRLGGRNPEFCRRSNRPGIGAPAVKIIADAVFHEYGQAEFRATGDVPRSLKIGNQSVPLGSYLRNKLRDEIGMDDEHKAFLQKAWQEEKLAEGLPDLLEGIKNGEAITLKQIAASKVFQAVLNVEAKSKLRKMSKI